MGRLRHARIKVLSNERHNNNGAFGHKTTNAAGVVEMMMGRDDVADRLVRKPLLDGFYHRIRSLFVKRPLDSDEMVAHLYDNRIVRASLNLVDAVGYLNEFHGRISTKILIATFPCHSSQEPLRSDGFRIGFLIPNGLRH